MGYESCSLCEALLKSAPLNLKKIEMRWVRREILPHLTFYTGMLNIDAILSAMEEVRSDDLKDMNTSELNCLRRSTWIEALEDLDEIHTNAEVIGSTNPFIGRTYLIATDNTMPYLHTYYLLQRIDSPLRWKAIITFSTQEDDCPVAYTECWESPHQADEFVKNTFCNNCYLASNRWCHECGISVCDQCGIFICDECSPNRTMCPMCMIEHNEF